MAISGNTMMIMRSCASGIAYVVLCSNAAVVSAFVNPQLQLPLRHFGSHDVLAQVAHHPSLVEEVSTKSDYMRNNQVREDMDTLDSFITTRPSWKFQGHDIYSQVSHPTHPSTKTLPAILLVHGFGVSSFYWRETIKALTKAGFTVYAIDLLGQGMSAKPTENIAYSTNLWAQQLDDFCRENLPHNQQVVLIGNSMGSMVSLIAATGDFANEEEKGTEKESCYIKEHLAGIGMFNCGIGMNVHSITRDPKWSSLQRLVLNANFNFMESVMFNNVALMKWILDKVVTKKILRDTLIQLYPVAENPEEIVDDKLVESIYLPAKDPGSPKVLSQILTNDAGLTPMEVHAKYGALLDELPIHVVWGDSDIVTPLDGIGEVAQFYTDLASSGGNHVSMEVVHGGHVVFDEVPDVANGSMLKWLNDEIVQQEKSSMSLDDLRDAFGHLREEIDHAVFGWLQPAATEAETAVGSRTLKA